MAEGESENIDIYLRGEALYGDDFRAAQIAAWYADEKEAYGELGAKDVSTYEYAYHAGNRLHAFRYIQRPRFKDVLGFGSAYGDEFLPIIGKIDRLTIVDPSEAFVRDAVHGVPVAYVEPDPSGRLPFPDGRFDLITCLGTLHHIPNVSFVVRELARVLQPGGHIALCEPIVSMGDWRKPRPGLTKRERGIPLPMLLEFVQSAGLRVLRKRLWKFPLTHRICNGFRPGGYNGIYNNAFITRVDALVSQAFAWNVNYHPRSLLRRLCPGQAYLLLTKS